MSMQAVTRNGSLRCGCGDGTNCHQIFTLSPRAGCYAEGMTDEIQKKDNAMTDHSLVADSVGIFVGVAALTKGLDIAKSTKAAHGTFLRFDPHLIGQGLTTNIKCHVKYGALAGVVFYVGSRLFPQQSSFTERIEAERNTNRGGRSL